MISVQDILKFVKDNKGTILTVTSIGTEIGADILYMVNADKLYKKEDRTKKDYVKAYALPTALSAASIVGIGFNDKFTKEDKAALLATNAALLASSKASMNSYKEAVKANVDEKTTKKIEEDASLIDADKIVIEAMESEENEEGGTIGKRWFVFMNLGVAVYTTPELVLTAVLNLNEELEYDLGEVTVTDFLSYLGEEGKDILKRPEFKTLDDLPHDDDRQVGWKLDENCYEDGVERITINQYGKTLKSGVEVTLVYFTPSPMTFKEWDDYYDDLWNDFYKDYKEKVLTYTERQERM